MRLSPSSAALWVHCPRSAQGCSLPSEVSDYGVAAHRVALLTFTDPHPNPSKLLGLTVLGVEVDDAMVNMVARYVDLVQSSTKGMHRSYETTIPCGPVKGTPDVVATPYSATGRTVKIFDFKTGYDPVMPDSLQMRMYAFGALREVLPACDTAEVIIFQPRVWRGDVVKRATLHRDDLLSEAFDWLKAFSRAGSDIEKPGPYCRFCPIAPQCPSFWNLAESIATTAASAPLADILPLKHLLSRAQAIIERRAKSAAALGQAPEGWVIGEGKGSRVFEPGSPFHGAVIPSEKRLTVAHAERLFGRKAIAPFVRRIPGQPVLMRSGETTRTIDPLEGLADLEDLE